MRHLLRVEELAKEKAGGVFFRANGGYIGEKGDGASKNGQKGGNPYWGETAQLPPKDQGGNQKHAPSPKRGQSPSKFTWKGERLAQIIEAAGMISDRLYRHDTCMAQDPESGCVAESIELAQGGSEMAEMAKSIGWKGSKLWFRDTIRGSLRNSSDPDDLGRMEEFPNLKADLYMIRQERKGAKARYRELRNLARGDMSDDTPSEDPAKSPNAP